MRDAAQILCVHSGHDSCGDPFIGGSSGNIHVLNIKERTLSLFIDCTTIRKWNNMKERLSFNVIQDGDTEGVMKIDLGDLTDNAIEIRAAIGIRKITEYSEEYKEVLRNRIKGISQ